MGSERFIKCHPIKVGYFMVCFRINGKTKFFYAHRVIGVTLIPNPDNKPQINHINGIKTDNRLENLEWVTRSENLKAAFKTGIKSNNGENNSKSKLKEVLVLEIRKKYLRYVNTAKMLSKEYGVSTHTIKQIVQRRRWAHI